MKNHDYNVTEFETAFASFMNRREFNKAENALFTMIRLSFRAGWLAATEDSQASPKLIHMPVAKLSFEDLQNSDV